MDTIEGDPSQITEEAKQYVLETSKIPFPNKIDQLRNSNQNSTGQGIFWKELKPSNVEQKDELIEWNPGILLNIDNLELVKPNFDFQGFENILNDPDAEIIGDINAFNNFLQTIKRT